MNDEQRERVRRKVQDNLRAKAAQLGPESPAPIAMPTAALSPLIYLCGHSAANIVRENCPSCAAENRQQRVAVRQAKRREKKQEQRQAESQTGRLPHGSSFQVSYDAGKTLWSGTLAVPRDGGTTQFFSGESSGVFRLLSFLDSQYRIWLGKQGGASNVSNP